MTACLHAVGGPSRGRSWALFRQDEHGNRTLVIDSAERAEAERLLAQYEAKGHKQVYWIEPMEARGRDDRTGGPPR